MTFRINNIGVELTEQSVHPDMPATGQWLLYFMSDGVYVMDDAGTYTLVAVYDATGISYTPGVLTHWEGDVDPGELSDALDQVASRLTTVEGAASGDVSGPVSSTDNALVRWDGAGGDTVQDSGVTLDDSDVLNMADNVVQRAELKDYAESHVAANSTATYTIDLENGNVFEITLTADCTFTFSNPPVSGKAGSFTLVLKQDGTGGWAPTWPASVDWAGGSAPTLTSTASAVDILTFLTTDGGTTWYGFLAGLDFS